MLLSFHCQAPHKWGGRRHQGGSPTYMGKWWLTTGFGGYCISDKPISSCTMLCLKLPRLRGVLCPAVAIRASFSLCRSWADWEVLVPLMSDKPWRVAECGCFTSLHHLSTSYCHVIGSVGCVHLVPMQYIHRSFCWTAKTFPFVELPRRFLP